MARSDGVTGVLSKGLSHVCAALVAFMTFAMSVQVMGRYLLHNPPGWTEELARVAFVYATFLGAALAVARHAHLGIDLVSNALPIRIRAGFQIAWRSIACVLLAIIAYQGYFLVERLSVQPLTSVPISKGFMFAGVPVGCAIMLLFEIGRLAREVRTVATGVDPDEENTVGRTRFIVESHGEGA